MRVRDGLRLDALRGVNDEQRALTGGQRTRDLVREVDVARRVDQIEVVDRAVALPQDAHSLGLDRDPPLALDIHRVEQLILHLAERDRVCDLKDAVGQRRLAVIDVRDDREVSDQFLVHDHRVPVMPSGVVRPRGAGPAPRYAHVALTRPTLHRRGSPCQRCRRKKGTQ